MKLFNVCMALPLLVRASSPICIRSCSDAAISCSDVVQISNGLKWRTQPQVVDADASTGSTPGVPSTCMSILTLATFFFSGSGASFSVCRSRNDVAVGACMLGWGASKLFVFRQGSALAVKSFCALNVVPMLLLTLNQAKRDGCAGLLFHLQAALASVYTYVGFATPRIMRRRQPRRPQGPVVSLPSGTKIWLA
mmetsp:Transcript_44888/g.104858  ORF Transcript_44888/g.104858 Transcript_44888/m.104858 type:complete len:194 (-) Transcript_44888:138-719(-)|eukprot:CAMPEP_0119351860 /NCGR_PEP_ID=MMETSP1334-20130426/1151_1 /TAXON_ID=127549 /ORGANISM="Calcidiscus leptoporus, Strain RCC1130" /LENGTH=193 /DNA_ID=CAMNT_0007364753 /DNA_START=42 /DNA_END=623 /DNA_ORIENTATION=+